MICFLDTTAIFAIEMIDEQPDGIVVRELIDFCNERGIEVFCSYASSNERQPDCTKPENYMAETSKQFRELLIRLNLGYVKPKEVPLFILAESRLGEACLSNKETIEFANSAAKIMVGTDYERLNSRSINGWKNRRDVEIFLTFVYNGGGILVTSDRHCLNNRDRLIAMAGDRCEVDIMKPQDALTALKELVKGS